MKRGARRHRARIVDLEAARKSAAEELSRKAAETTALSNEVAQLVAQLDVLRSVNRTVSAQLGAALQSGRDVLRESQHDKLRADRAATALDASRKKSKALGDKIRRTTRRRDKLAAALDLERTQRSWLNTAGGAYPQEVRELMRKMLAAGCRAMNVGKLFGDMLDAFKIPYRRVPDRRTVARTELEGRVAAMIQMGFELGRSKGELLIFRYNHNANSRSQRHNAQQRWHDYSRRHRRNSVRLDGRSQLRETERTGSAHQPCPQRTPSRGSHQQLPG